jgi:hypothetical protein
MGRWGDADAAGIKAGVDALRTIGGTNFQAGPLLTTCGAATAVVCRSYVWLVATT